MKRRAFGAALAVGCILAFMNACGDEERDFRKQASRPLPQESGDATGQGQDASQPSSGGETADNTASLPNKASQLNWNGTEQRGDADFNVFATE